MIKRLRAKFISITMILFMVMLLVILGLIIHFTRQELAERSITMLQTVHFAPDLPDEPGRSLTDMPEPCFILAQGPNGELLTAGSAHYDLTDEGLLREILQQAKASDQETGILYAHSLRFCRVRHDGREHYAFTDISAEAQTLWDLVVHCTIIGLVSMGGFFLISWGLSRWMVRPVEESWNRQRQFIADASHELKTPLTVIMTNAELLRSDEYDTTAKDRFAGSIHTMSTQMRGLVEDMLDLARVDYGTAREELSTLDLSAVTEEAMLPFEAVYFEAGRELSSRVQPDILVRGNAQRLRQVVEILLDNGCKYSRAGTTVTLTLERRGLGHCQLSVASQGETLSSQQCRDIFKRFYRADESRKMNHSYGLGLPIAQSIVEQHKGKIWCHSKNGVNTFYVSLPTTNH